MKNLTKMAGLLLCLLLGAAAQAQENKDSKYLSGAVPEVDGKVVFSKEYSIPGMSQDEVFDRLLRWMEGRLQENKNDSRVLYTNREKGQIVGMGDDWIVFSSSALSLDRTRILYQLTVVCQPEKCSFSIEKIRYIYMDGEEKYVAEEWITDKYALNKAKTKLVRGLAKWRRKTVDFADAYYQQVADALSAVDEPSPATEQAEPAKPAANEPMVIVPKKKVVAQDVQVVKEKPETAAPQPEAGAAYREMAPAELTSDWMQSGTGRLVIVIGTDPFNQTVMTANAGGSLGQVDGKPVVFTILSPDQAHGQLDQAAEYVVRFYPNGATEPTVVLQCRKLPSPETPDGMPRTYIGEIVKASVLTK